MNAQEGLYSKACARGRRKETIMGNEIFNDVEKEYILSGIEVISHVQLYDFNADNDKIYEYYLSYISSMPDDVFARYKHAAEKEVFLIMFEEPKLYENKLTAMSTIYGRHAYFIWRAALEGDKCKIDKEGNLVYYLQDQSLPPAIIANKRSGAYRMLKDHLKKPLQMDFSKINVSDPQQTVFQDEDEEELPALDDDYYRS
ncbi:MAG: hypothetical protein HFI85_05790 [Clostridia bacterium]|jgi:hypothetical protein|nr:hypothetical protein [Clostridia bacterium]